jgi:outer membrane receptor protein involved in Fe transport
LLPVFFRNEVRGAASGFEIAPVWNAATGLRLKGAYSFLNLDFETAPGSGDQSTVTQIEGSSPRHQLVIQSLLDLPRRWELDAAYRYVSELSYAQGDGYHTADVQVSWEASENLRLSFTARNLFDANHVEFRSSPEPNIGVRRSLLVSFTYQN